MSNSFSTGGGGVSFERRIAVIYMIQLLSGDIPRGMEFGRATTIRLQAKTAGFPLDDLLVTTEDGRSLQIQIKHGLTFSENSDLLKEVLAECWNAFSGVSSIHFDKSRDFLGIAVDGLTQEVRKHLLPLFGWASSSTSADEFIFKVSSISSKQKYAELFRRLLSIAKQQPLTDGELWDFFKCMRILEFDVLQSGSRDENEGWNNLLHLAPNQSATEARSIFDTLLSEVDRLAPQAGTVDRSSLHLRIRLRHPDFWPNFLDDYGLADDLAKIDVVYVPPTEYEHAYTILKRDQMVIIAGPPHSGKSATGLYLALKLKEQDEGRPIVRIRSGDDFDAARIRAGAILVLDDYYGDLQLDQATRAGRFSDLERLSRRCFVIITTRSSVLSEARQSTRLAEERGLDQHIVVLSQEGSYDDRALYSVLRRHLDFMVSDQIQVGRRLSSEQVRIAWEARYLIVQELRFPHNIERFCWSHLILPPTKISRA